MKIIEKPIFSSDSTEMDAFGLESLLETATIISGNTINDKLCETIIQIKDAKSVVILQGAGVSVASGIPDFRSKTGMFAKYSEKAFEKETFLETPEILYGVKREWYKHTYVPNEGHRLGRHLYDQGTLRRIYTQNIDGLQYKALDPDDEDIIVEFHGNLRSAQCGLCKVAYPIEVFKDAMDKEEIARCSICDGPIKPAVILYGDEVNSSYFHQAVTDLRQADLVIVMGTSLQVNPFASIMNYVMSPVIVINKEVPEKYPAYLIPRTTFLLGEIESIAKMINPEFVKN